jgi:hypothetical protein
VQNIGRTTNEPPFRPPHLGRNSLDFRFSTELLPRMGQTSESNLSSYTFDFHKKSIEL